MKAHTTIFILCFLAIPCFAPAQESKLADVLLPQSPEADNLISDAEAAASESDWATAASAIHKAMQKYHWAVIKTGDNLFVGVRAYCIEKSRRWGEPFLKAYRTLFDAQAEQLFRRGIETKNTSLLQEVSNTYFLSSYADNSLYHFAAEAMAKGDFQSALAALKTIVNSYPDSEIPIQNIYARIALCLYYQGMTAELEALRNEVKGNLAGRKIETADGRISISKFIRRMIELSRVSSPDPSRRGIYHLKLNPALAEPPPENLVSLASIRIPHGPLAAFESDESEEEDLLDQIFDTHSFHLPNPLYVRSYEEYLPFHPECDGANIYLATDTALFTYDLFTGNSIWAMDATMHLCRGREHNPTVSFKPTIHDGKILLNMVVDYREARMFELFDVEITAEQPVRAFTAHDIGSLRLIWVHGGPLSDDSFYADASFPVPPCDMGTILYIPIIHSTETNVPPSIYVCAFEAHTGRQRWRTKLCTGAPQMNLFNNPMGEHASSLIVQNNGRLYLSTNVGVLAALDAYSGAILWLRSYETIHAHSTREIIPEKMPILWISNVPTIWGNCVIFTPLDSNFALAIDANSGELLWMIPRTHYRFLAGVRDGIAYFTGYQHPNMEHIGAHNVHTGKKVKEYTLPLQDEEVLRGKPAICEQFLLVPSTRALYRINLGDNSVQRIPWSNSSVEWGNVFLFGDTLITTNKTHLNIFVDVNGVRAYLEDILDQAQGSSVVDPWAHYRLGRLLVSLGEFETAISHFEKALKKIPREKPRFAWLVQVVRRSLVNACLSLVESTAQTSTSQKINWLERALNFCDDPTLYRTIAQRLESLLSALGEWPRIVHLYQDVLKRFPHSDVNGSTMRDFIREKIQSVIAIRGAEVYAPFEAQAQEKFRIGVAHADPERLQDVLTFYPNSSVYQETFGELATIYADHGRYEHALGLLERFIEEFPESGRTPDALLGIGLAHARLGHNNAARTILKEVKNRFPNHIPTWFGFDRPAGEIVVDLLHELPPPPARAAETKSVLTIPIDFEISFSEEGFGLPRPVKLSGTLPTGCEYNVLYALGRHLRLINLVPDRKSYSGLWRTNLADTVRSVLVSGKTLVCICDSSVIAVDVSSGKISERLRIEGVFGHGRYLYHELTPDDLLVIVYSSVDNRRTILATVATDTLSKLWEISFEGQAGTPPVVCGERVFISTEFPNFIRAFYIGTGMSAGNIQLERGSAVALFSSTGNGQVIVVDNTGGLHSYDFKTLRQTSKGRLSHASQIVGVKDGKLYAVFHNQRERVVQISATSLDSLKEVERWNTPLTTGEQIIATAIEGNCIFVMFHRRFALNRHEIGWLAFDLESRNVLWERHFPVQGNVLTGHYLLHGENLLFLTGTKPDGFERPWTPKLRIWDKNSGVEMERYDCKESPELPRFEIVNGFLCLFEDVSVTIRGNTKEDDRQGKIQ